MKRLNFRTFKSLIEKSDVMAILLLHCGEKTCLPELYAVFGKDLILEFLSVCAGLTIKVPQPDVFEKMAKEVEIYMGLKGSLGAKRDKLVDKLASIHNMDPFEIRKIAKSVSSRVRRVKGEMK